MGVLGGTLLSAIAFQAVANLSPRSEVPLGQMPRCQAYRGASLGQSPWQPWDNSSPAGCRYDRQSIKTIRGTVLSTDATLSPQPGFFHGRRLLIKSGDETIAVHLGPFWYLKQQEFKISQNDEVVVTGSYHKGAGTPTIIAQKIQAGNQTLQLRNSQGIPNWRPGYRQGGPGGCW